MYKRSYPKKDKAWLERVKALQKEYSEKIQEKKQKDREVQEQARGNDS